MFNLGRGHFFLEVTKSGNIKTNLKLYYVSGVVQFFLNPPEMYEVIIDVMSSDLFTKEKKSNNFFNDKWMQSFGNWDKINVIHMIIQV